MPHTNGRGTSRLKMSIYLPKPVVYLLKKVAKDENQSLSQMVTRALWEYFNRR